MQILFLPKSLKRPLLPLLGQLSVAHTETFYTRNVKPSGRRRSSLSVLHLVVCGNRSTPIMGRGHVPLSTSIESVRPPLTLHRRVMSPYHHTANFRLFASSPMMTSSLPSANFWTSSAPQTHFQLGNVDVLAPFITNCSTSRCRLGVSIAFQGCIHHPFSPRY